MDHPAWRGKAALAANWAVMDLIDESPERVRYADRLHMLFRRWQMLRADDILAGKKPGYDDFKSFALIWI